ncbi:MAG: DUF2914 domain-containing protein [Spirochaetes bacterium]|nr:DUF2914 domain-containing protein [Spirochaetota bacterium]
MLRKIIQYYTEGVPPRKNFPEGAAGFYLYIKQVFSDIPPGISRLLKLQPLFAFTSGIIVILLLRRGYEHVPFVIICIILTFIYLAFRLYIQKKKSNLLKNISVITVMFSVNYMLLFIMPFYFDSITVPSRNMIFGMIIIALAVISNWYYLFDMLILKSFLTSSIYYALIFFCVLNFIFPIILGIRNIWSLAVSGCIAAITAIILVYPYMRIKKNWSNFFKFLSGIALSLALLWFGRSFIPPAPLKLVYATACENIEDHRPLAPFAGNTIEGLDEIYFYTAIFAPRGLREQINHVWYHNGERMLSIPLSPIEGGRDRGYRTWSKRAIHEGKGEYTVEVWTVGGQFLGERSFVLR